MVGKKRTYNLVIADDHPIFRAGLKTVLAKDAQYKVVGEASDGAEALKLVDFHNPEFLILDMDMPILDGISVLKHLQSFKSRPKVIVITMYNEPDIYNEVMNYSTEGYIVKDGVLNELLECLEIIISGKTYTSPSLLTIKNKRELLLKNSIQQKNKLADLSKAEINVIKLIAAQKTSSEIANILFISPKTVENHRSNICKKLNLSGQNALLKWAIQNSDIVL